MSTLGKAQIHKCMHLWLQLCSLQVECYHNVSLNVWNPFSYVYPRNIRQWMSGSQIKGKTWRWLGMSLKNKGVRYNEKEGRGRGILRFQSRTWAPYLIALPHSFLDLHSASASLLYSWLHPRQTFGAKPACKSPYQCHHTSFIAIAMMGIAKSQHMTREDDY